MMATFEGINWQAFSALTVSLSIFATSMAWIFNKVYRLGKTDQRIANIEYILNVEYRDKFKAIDKRFDKIDEKFDKIDEKFDRVEDKIDKLNNLLLKKQ